MDNHLFCSGLFITFAPMIANRAIYHLAAFVTVAIWGSTFVFTKMLLDEGLSPAQIFTLRFAIAYVILLAYSLRHKPESRTSRAPAPPYPRTPDLRLLLLGITGGSLYFLLENAALLYTTATNTSLIVCSCPLFTMLLIAAVYRRSERITRRQALGSVLACLGMAVVVLNGHFVLHLSPLGDMLAFGACLCWAVYSLLMKQVSGTYDSLTITRKVFFYGLLTILPYYLFVPQEAHLCTVLMNLSAQGYFNLLFLGVIASMLCYLVWSWVIRRLGAVEATNWVYVNPVSTIIFAWWILDEEITPWFLMGTALILLGLFFCDKRQK